MQKLKELHLNVIEETRTLVETPKKESKIIISSVAASKSAEITKDVVIKFATYISKYGYQGCNEDWTDNWGISTLTTEQLFEEFLKQYNGTIK